MTSLYYYLCLLNAAVCMFVAAAVFWRNRFQASCRKRWVWVPLLVLTVALTVIGLRGGQAADVANWFNVVCSSCIGLTPR